MGESLNDQDLKYRGTISTIVGTRFLPQTGHGILLKKDFLNNDM